jgi:hypothetical protein
MINEPLSLSAERATLASKAFQMISEGRLAGARDLLDAALDTCDLLTDDMKSVLSLYDTLGLPRITKLTPPRKRALRARLKEHPEYTWWENFFARVKRSDFLMGRKKGVNWKATFDWLMKPANLQKVLEGNYDQQSANGFSESDEVAFRMSNI